MTSEALLPAQHWTPTVQDASREVVAADAAIHDEEAVVSQAACTSYKPLKRCWQPDTVALDADEDSSLVGTSPR